MAISPTSFQKSEKSASEMLRIPHHVGMIKYYQDILAMVFSAWKSSQAISETEWSVSGIMLFSGQSSSAGGVRNSDRGLPDGLGSSRSIFRRFKNMNVRN